jgi:integrase
VDRRAFSRSFRTRVEADRYRISLLKAQETGDAFDPAKGEPESWAPRDPDVDIYQWCNRWLAEQWEEWQPRTRASAVEALARFLPLTALPAAAAPTDLRARLTIALRPEGTTEDRALEEWLSESMPLLAQLDRQLLAEVDRRLGLRDDGRLLASSTASRYRKVARACVRRAVELEVLPADPWPPSPRGRAQRKVNRTQRGRKTRTLPDRPTMERIIAAMSSHQPASETYRVMTSVAYYGGLRPSEVVMLRPAALRLPARGWGEIHVTEADVDFDDPGEPKMGARTVPIPAVLVGTLRGWLDSHDLAADDLLFRTRTGRRPSSSNWARSLQRATKAAGAPTMRVYDCRHAAATTWIRAGAPLGEVARRLGHSVETLVSTYVGVLDGDAAIANERIEHALEEGNRRAA